MGLTIGPLFLTEALSWRWFFFVDVLGLATATAGLVALMLAFQQSDPWGRDLR